MTPTLAAPWEGELYLDSVSAHRDATTFLEALPGSGAHSAVLFPPSISRADIAQVWHSVFSKLV